jgi:hypothetical protein
MDQPAVINEYVSEKYSEDLLNKYTQGNCDLPTLVIKLIGITKFDVEDFLQRSIPHEERWQEIQRMKKNNKLPIDSISRAEQLYLGSSSQG